MNAALTVAYLWFFGLLLAGVMTIHQYTIGKMLGTVLVTIVAMLALCSSACCFLICSASLSVLYTPCTRSWHCARNVYLDRKAGATL